MTFPPPFKIAVVGGGIGGLFAALSLHHHCGSAVSIDVYEQAREYKEIGAGLALGPNAAKLLYKLGLGHAAMEIAGKRAGVWFTFRKFDDGDEVVTVKVPNEATVKSIPMHRAQFLDLLTDAIRARNAATLHVNKRCQGVTDQGDVVSIKFADGTTATANMVVGCDGVHSAVRGQFATDKPRYSGQIAYRGLVPISAIEKWWGFDAYSVIWLGKDRHFLVFPISQNETLNIVAFVAEAKENLGDLRESWTSLGEKKDVFEAFQGFEERVQKLIGLMEDKPSKWLINDRVPLDQWVYLNGKAVLLGDAAHAMTPHQGAGAGQSVEDGYILGKAVSDYLRSSRTGSDSLASWLQIYQQIRLPRAQKVQRTSLDTVEIYQARAGNMKNLPFGECVQEIGRTLENKMKWIWNDDIDAEYEQAVKSRT